MGTNVARPRRQTGYVPIERHFRGTVGSSYSKEREINKIKLFFISLHVHLFSKGSVTQPIMGCTFGANWGRRYGVSPKMNVFQVGGYYSGKCILLDFLNESITEKVRFIFNARFTSAEVDENKWFCNTRTINLYVFGSV